MKKVLLVFILVLIIGCVNHTPKTRNVGGFEIVEVDSCEYLRRSDIGGFSYFAHKGNCKYCTERRKQELKENDRRK